MRGEIFCLLLLVLLGNLSHLGFSQLPTGPMEMKKVSGNFRTGAVYEVSWQPPYSSEHYFEVSDGQETARFPTYEGGTLAPVDVLSERLDQNKIYLAAGSGASQYLSEGHSFGGMV